MSLYMPAAAVSTGLERAIRQWPASLKSADAGLVVHPASVNHLLEHSSDLLINTRKFRIKSFFGPQHGIRGETQDNMIEWSGFRDKKTGLPVHSLYGKTRKPDRKMLEGIDVMIVDLQDVGARYYTFIWTLALVMEACEAAGRTVVILDRPNPLNGIETEGPVLKKEFSSFVGLYPLPVRHAMTIAEIGMYLKKTAFPSLDLRVIPMTGWRRRFWMEDTGLPWVMPSPNLPTVDSAVVYPGICLLEGTNLSEGRGTTRPFEIFGAPYVEPGRFKKRLDSFKLPGIFFRPLSFLPTFQKHAGKVCGGCQIHVLDRKKFRPFLTAFAILKTAAEMYPADFRWKQPPYEYEARLLPIDILAGTDRFRKYVDAGKSLKQVRDWIDKEAADFDLKVRRDFLLYS